MKQQLENEYLEIALIPAEGGRIASIRSRSSGLEFLLQTSRTDTPLPAGLEANFAEGPCAGIEECLPSVGRCSNSTGGGPVPDHGDFWQLPWCVEASPQPDSLHLAATGFSRPLRFRKQLTLRGQSLHVRYAVENIGCETTSFLYACHPLFAVDAGDRILLPESISALRLHFSHRGRLGQCGSSVAWPSAAGGHDLSLALPADAGVGDMLYTDRLEQGWCALYRSRARQAIAVHFDVTSLPWLGLWLCYGGWPEPHVTPERPRQYAVALEPTTAPWGTLEQAQAAGLARTLAPGAIVSWTLYYTVSVPGIDVDQVRYKI